MKSILITISIILGLTLNTISSENNSVISTIKLKLYNAYVSDNSLLWLEGMNELKTSYKKTNSINTLFELSKSQYGYMGLLIDKQEFEKAKKILPEAEKNITKLLEQNPEWADAYALLAGIYGFKIILYPNLVIYNGPKGKNYMEKASELKNITPAVIIEMGNYKYHTPILLGGNIEEAILYYKKAINQIEIKKQDKNNWQYINAMVWLAISYDKKGENDKALATLNKLLEKEPNLIYVKKELYPKIAKKGSIEKTYYTLK